MGNSLEVTLITGRTIKQGIGLVKGKHSKEYKKATKLVQLSEKDIDSLNLKEGQEINISTRAGEIKLPCKKGDLPSGLIFIPLGPWANKLISGDTTASGMPSSKGIDAKISLGGE